MDFTGGIGEFIVIKDYAENSGRLFKLLLRTFKMNSLVCCNLGVSRMLIYFVYLVLDLFIKIQNEMD